MELRDDAFDAAEEVVVQAGLHGRLRAFRDNRLRPCDLHFGQLRGRVPQGGGAGADARGDESADHRGVRGHVVEGGGGAEIGHEDRSAVLVVGSRAVGDAVGAHVLRIVHADVDAGLHARPDDHRVDVEELHDARAERMHHLRHHGRDDHIADIARRVSAQVQELHDHQPVFVGGVVRLRGDAVCAGDAFVVKESDDHVGVADVDGDQKHIGSPS